MIEPIILSMGWSIPRDPPPPYSATTNVPVHSPRCMHAFSSSKSNTGQISIQQILVNLLQCRLPPLCLQPKSQMTLSLSGMASEVGRIPRSKCLSPLAA